VRVYSSFTEAAAQTTTTTPAARVYSSFVEAAGKTTATTPTMRVFSSFVEVAVKRPPPGGWSVGRIRIS